MRVGVLVLALVACDGTPAPLVGELSPKIVCGSGTLPLALSGQNFLAEPTHTLAGAPSLIVPEVSLLAPSASPIATVVMWLSSDALTVSVPLDQLHDASYSLSLTNPDGQRAHLEAALTRVDATPVAITSVSPAPFCLAGDDQTLLVSGSGFSPSATVIVQNDSGAQVLAPEVSPAPTAFSFTLPKGSLAPGSYTLVLENPVQSGCQVTAAQPFVVDEPPAIAHIQPGQICSAGARLALTGSGLEAGAKVELTDGKATLAATNVRVSNQGRVAVVVFGGNSLPKNSQADLVWSNPGGCATTVVRALKVKPGKGCN